MSLVSFLKDSYIEFKDKVEWPKWPSLQSSTAIVAISTLILSIFTFGVDTFFSRLINNTFSILINLFN
ncbi:preprotein translocase subunit SecE [Riemerella columbina]|uniref:preprotein translocase subunit SecE n=1 Tax=Riemerella columbina TaxID=103810 RepID=UPI0003721AA8|nr:preprotein translocase subunit SecE [Riemerella columbina]